MSTETCQWYALCENDAAGIVEHPTLGDVPTCQRCADKHDLVIIRRTEQDTQVIESVERLLNSKNGNPRYRVFFRGGGVAETAVDASVNYGISNADVHGHPVKVTYERGKIVRVVRVDGRADA